MNDPQVLATRQGAVLVLTLNRPSALNGFTSELHHQLLGALDAAADDDSVRCLIITGAGRGFCVGQDLADPTVAPDPSGQVAPNDLGEVIDRFYKPLVLRLRSMPVPVIAAVNGVAAGAGANLALACDIVLAARSASFVQAFARIGLIPDTGGTWLLPRLVGQARALGMALLGEKLSAPDAERMGLIWRCVDDAALMDAATRMASRLTALPVKALVTTRMAMNAAQSMNFEQALAAEAKLQSDLGSSHDYQEGVNAFMNKRAPAFQDR